MSDWRNFSRCRDTDPELHFPIGTGPSALRQAAEAKAVCGDCGVKDDCLRWALDNGVDHGIWGGLTEEERRAVKRRGGLPVRPA